MIRSLPARTIFSSFLALAAACAPGGSQAPPSPPAPEQEQGPELELEPEPAAKPALPSDVQEGLEAVRKAGETHSFEGESSSVSVLAETGELVSPIRSELSPKLPGRVGKIFVDSGARVKAGQPLLSLETDYLELEVTRAEAALESARAAVEEARGDFARKEELLEKESVSQALYDRTKAMLVRAQAAQAQAEAALALAKQRLADAVLVSPIDGIVADRRVDVGERLGEAGVAFVVVQVSPLKLRFRLPERYLAEVAVGQLVRARVEPYPDDVFEGRVTVVVRAIEPSTRSFVVEAEIPNRDERLKPGLFARVELDLSETEAS
jgi:RND family efflux transporter MFP subunit